MTVAFLGLGLVAAAIVVYLASLGLRRTGPTSAFFAVAAAGVAVAALAMPLGGAPWWPAAAGAGATAIFVAATLKELRLPRPPLGLGVGARFPAIAVTTTAGQEVTLDALARPALVVVYRGWWCPYCVTQLGALAGDHAALRAEGITSYAISVDRPDEQVALERRLGGAVTFLSDVPGRLVDALGVRHPDGVPWYDRLLFGARRQDIALPATYLVDASGVVRFARRAARIDERPRLGEILAAWRAARPAPPAA